MKRVLAILGAVTVLFAFGCANPVSDDVSENPTVNVGSAADIPASEATSSPADAATSQAMFADMMQGLMYSMDSESASLDSRVSVARATETESKPFSYVSEDGNINITGSMTATNTYPEETFMPTANTTYNDIIVMAYALDLAGTLNGAVITGGDVGSNYTVSGKIGEIMSLNMNVDITTGTDLVEGTDATSNMDMSMSLKYGAALSIRRNDGIGARFFITYDGSAGLSNYSITTISEEEGPDMEGVITELTRKTATLQVYTDEGTLIHSASLPLVSLPGAFPFSSVRDESEEF